MSLAFHHLAGSVDPVRRFKQETLAFLSGLIEVTGAVFYSVDGALNAVDHALYRLTAERLRDYVDYFHKLDPLHPRRFAHTGRFVVSIEDAMPRGMLERSAYFREFLQPIGGHHEVDLYLYDREALVGGVSLLRDAARPSFAANELALLTTARPYVAYTFGLERRVDAAACAVGGVTPRELEVVRLVCRGASNLEIGRELGIALPTVKTHLVHVCEKLGVRTRAQLIARIAATPSRPISGRRFTM